MLILAMAIASIVTFTGSAFHISRSFRSKLTTSIEVDTLGPMSIIDDAVLALFEEGVSRMKVSIFSFFMEMSSPKESIKMLI